LELSIKESAKEIRIKAEFKPSLRDVEGRTVYDNFDKINTELPKVLIKEAKLSL
jgi:phosphoribosylformylglycinamidine (FGAM) synthase PurS component